MVLIDGKRIAEQLREKIASQVKQFTHQQKRPPGLCTFLIGNDPASEIYIRNKHKAVQECGMYGEHIQLPDSVSEIELLQHIEEKNVQTSIDGILVQLPLPSHINSQKVLTHISPLKDVDGFHPENVGLLSLGMPRFVPCTPKGCFALLQTTAPHLRGKHAVIVGRSNIVGKPLASLLLNHDATITICHRNTPHLEVYTSQADILVSAVGKINLIQKQHIKPGAIVLDVGINKTSDGKLRGDVAFEEVAPLTSAITPVPGGVGPMTIAMLLQNTLDAYYLHEGKGP